MSSSSRRPVTLDAVERFLREHGLDESHARAVHDALAAAERHSGVAGPDSQQSDLRVTTVYHGPGAARPREEERDSGAAPTMWAAGAASVPPTTRREGPPREPADVRKLVPGLMLGAGGMGEVFRVRDHALHRQLAMKVLLAELAEQPALRERFLAEAQVTAQLAHPGVPPVHAVGELDDGRPYFTMKEVHGITLADVIEEAHDELLGASRWSEQRLLEIFQKICDAVAYAHSRNVVHCDLKPLNVMVGAFGEVLVMDWGVARVVPPAGGGSSEPPVVIGAHVALDGFVAGTPSYMPPEQARGVIELQADVYALGVMLYELLSGTRPYRGNPLEMLEQATRGVVPPLPKRQGSSADEELLAIISRAMAPNPAQRYRDAKALGDDLARWREGAMRREKALALVQTAREMLPGIQPTFDRAAGLRERAARALAELAPDAPVEAKAPLWELEDQAASLTRDAQLRFVEAEQLLLNALAQAPDFDDAKALIAELRYHRHRDAEQRRAWDEAAGHEVVLRRYDTGAYRDYLAGTASLSIDSEPSCLVRLHRLVRRGRRLAPELERELGHTPLLDVEVPIGSYLLELVARDRPPVWYPIVLRRRSGWDGRRPAESTPFKVRLPAAGEVLPGEILIADGSCELGGDDRAIGALPLERMWIDAFVMREHPVTFAEIAPFLAAPEGEPYRRTLLRDGLSVWRHDWPAVGLSWEGACAYAAWLGKRTGKPWRLPSEAEWEKAARGADGRYFPWGDFTDPAFCHSRTIEQTPRTPVSIHAFPMDRSAYGVRGMGGNVRDWCIDAAGLAPSSDGPRTRPDGALAQVVRGGSYRLPPEAARVAARAALLGGNGYTDVGLRLVRSLY